MNKNTNMKCDLKPDVLYMMLNNRNNNNTSKFVRFYFKLTFVLLSNRTFNVNNDMFGTSMTWFHLYNGSVCGSDCSDKSMV